MRRLIVLAVALLAAFAVTPSAVAGWSPVPPLGATRVLEYNIGSGSECGGYNGTPVEDCLSFLESEVVNYSPFVIAGEEFCHQDYVNFADWLHSQNADWHVHFSYMDLHKQPLTIDPYPDDYTNGLGCPKPGVQNPDPNNPADWESKGTVLAIAYPVAGTYTEDVLTGSTTDNRYTLACEVTSWGSTYQSKACVTHLIAGSANATTRTAQIEDIQALQEGWSRPMIAGDFNLALGSTDFQGYLSDTLSSGVGDGSKKMIDPESTSYVDHITFRKRPNITYASNVFGNTCSTCYSTHHLHEAWAYYG